MTLNTGTFSLELGKRLKCNISTSSNLQLMEASKSVQMLGNGIVHVVTNFSDLPAVTSILIGHIYFVTSEERLYYARDLTTGWVPLLQSTNNTLWTWGTNYRGAIAVGTNPTNTSRSSPGTTNGCGINWCQISVGENATLGLKTDGTLWGWGLNSYGDLGSIGIATYSPVTMPGAGNTWCKISKGTNTSAGLKSNGVLWMWGRNNSGQLGFGTSCYGSNSPVTTAGCGTTWCDVATNQGGSGIKTDGTLWTWGCNAWGQLGDGTTTNRCSPGTTAGGGNNWCQVTMGSHMLAIKTDGTLWSWGYNRCGALGTGNITYRSSPGTTAGGGTTWCCVNATISWNTIGIKTDGTLWTWGRNFLGNLGDNTVLDRSSPGTTVGGGTTWCSISSGKGGNQFVYLGQTFAGVKTDGTLWTWGANSKGQLGDGTVVCRSSPGTIAGGGNNWCLVSQGKLFTVAIKVV